MEKLSIPADLISWLYRIMSNPAWFSFVNNQEDYNVSLANRANTLLKHLKKCHSRYIAAKEKWGTLDPEDKELICRFLLGRPKDSGAPSPFEDVWVCRVVFDNNCGFPDPQNLHRVETMENLMKKYDALPSWNERQRNKKQCRASVIKMALRPTDVAAKLSQGLVFLDLP